MAEQGMRAKAIYTAEATVTGGREQGHGASSDGALDVELRPPRDAGGDGGGTNPEQLFAVGYAACFESALALIGRRERMETGEVSIDARVSLYPTEERGFVLGVELDVSLPAILNAAQAKRLVSAAHAVCPYSSAIRRNVVVGLTANGEPVVEIAKGAV